MLIRIANKNDARRISYLIKRNTEKVKENNYSDEQMAVWKKANTPQSIVDSLDMRIIFCAFQKDKLIGVIGLQGNEVVGLYVSYSKRGRGIGKQLLSHLEEYALMNTIFELQLTATPSAVKFYLRNGYMKDVAVVVTIDGVDFREMGMRKELKINW